MGCLIKFPGKSILHGMGSIVLVMLLCMSSMAANAEESEELIRASVIEKVARFIDWPSSNTLAAQFLLCLSEKTPLFPTIQTYYANSLLWGRVVTIKTYRQIKELADCQAVYLGAEQGNDLAAILAFTQNQPILIITEGKDDVSRAAHVDFYIEDGHIRVEVNRTSLQRSGLKASYHLLRVARLVE